MRRILLCVLLSTLFFEAFSQEIDTTVVYEYDTVYLPADTIEQLSIPKPEPAVPASKQFSVLLGFSGYNLKGQDQSAGFSSLTEFNNSFSYDAGIGLRCVLSSLLIQTGFGINIYNEHKTSTVFSHADTTVTSAYPDSKNTLMVYYMADIRNRWVCLNVPLMLGYSGQWKKLEYHAMVGMTVGYTVLADIYYIDPASESILKKGPGEYRKFNETLVLSAGAGYQMLPGLYIEMELGYRKMFSDAGMLPEKLAGGLSFLTLGLRKQFYLQEANESK